MPALSALFAIRPPRASTSFARWLLPIPPIAGLQDISPIFATSCVMRATLNPMREETSAASTPACPPPITITSKLSTMFINKLVYLLYMKIISISYY